MGVGFVLIKSGGKDLAYAECIGAGSTWAEDCQTAELYLRSAIGKVRCQATACSCQKANFDVARP